MGYYSIGKYKVFYSNDRFYEINKPFVEKLSATDMLRLNMLDLGRKPSKKAIELHNLRIKKLNEDYKNLSNLSFIKKWVRFEFDDQVAPKIAWEVIYDYFHLHKNGRIVDLRAFDQVVEDDYLGLSYTFPQGEVVELEFKTLRNNFISRLFSNTTVTFTLNLSSIQFIEGTLSELQIETSSKKIVLGQTVKVIDKE